MTNLNLCSGADKFVQSLTMSRLAEMQECIKILEKAINGSFSLCELSPYCAFRKARDTFRRFQTISQRVEKGTSSFCVELPAIQFESPGRSLRERNLIQKLLAFRKRMEVVFPQVILHGSLACGSLTNYSDVDSLVVVTDRVFLDMDLFFKARCALKDLQKDIFEFDPLQHHGSHTIPESALLSYPPSYLPFSVLEEAKAVGSPISLKLTPITLHLGRQRQQAYIRLTNAVLSTKAVPKTAYQAKTFLSVLMLVPAFALQAEGCEISKRRSFADLKRRFAEPDWEPMAWATYIRDIWPRFELSRVERIALKTFNPWLVSRVLLMRRPLPEFLVKEWTPQRHASLLAFAELVRRTVKIDSEITEQPT